MTQQAPASVATCCIVSGILGNRIFSKRLLEAVDVIGTKPMAEMYFAAEAYRLHPAPWLLRMSDELEAEAVFRRMLAHDGLPNAATYIVNGVWLAIVAHKRNPKANWIVATDSTPLMTDRLRARGYAEVPGLIRRAFRSVQSARFRRFARQVEWWLPMSATCRESLVEDYGVARERCLVTSAPQASVDTEIPSRKPSAGRWRLLFVGNDFRRKGGPQLCEALKRLPNAELTIVSRDPEAARFGGNLNDRISLVSHVEEPSTLEELYRRSHLLVHPTFVDNYSHVICEGLARGLPFVVTEGTPPAELVGQSSAGRTIDWPPSAESVARAVTAILGDSAQYNYATERALAFAQERLAPEPFRNLLRHALQGCVDQSYARASG